MDIESARAMRSQIAADTFDTYSATVRPMATGRFVNDRATDDESRAASALNCSLQFNPPMTQGARSFGGEPALRGEPVAWGALITAFNPGSWPYQPRRGDHIEIAGDRYEIADIGRDGGARAIWHCNKAKIA